MSELKKCPFCGKKVAECKSVVEIEEIDENNDLYGRWEDTYEVVCNYNKGGCGATSGARGCKDEAIEAWNRRGKR